ncbi:ABC transporter ATP-binding protein [Mangrovibacillus cuniculi]|uniref:ABC transporter ATP-binding protein n=1 Tax=Mangrovibacillus cuniculi TaxID=2593652 RepID=A0A7S8C970_9BACI|nr:ABC transporter ATP-binding protein [Mangrovibacillus cuniculi]QPC45720.1 ABC transporter ATP-binding protein [Mangrovibacillus cuniculi]
MNKLRDTVWGYRLSIFVAVFLMLVELAVELALPFILKKIVDDGIQVSNMDAVVYWGVWMVVLSILAFFSGVTNTFFSGRVSQGVSYDLRKALMEKVQKFSYSDLHMFSTSSYITRMTNDVTQIGNTLFMSLRVMLRAPLLIIGSVIMSFIIDPGLTIILLATVPIIITFLIFVLRIGSKQFKQVQQRLDEVNRVIRENLMGVRIVRAFIRAPKEESRFGHVNSELKDDTIRVLKLMETMMPILLLVMNTAILLLLIIGREKVLAGQTNVGDMVALMNYALRVSSVFSIFSFLIMAFSRARASAGRVAEVLDADEKLPELKEGRVNLRLTAPPSIQFDKVSYDYPESSEYALTQVSLQVRQGDKLAIMGGTGAGKSTLLQLIPGLLVPTNGEIQINETSIADLSISELRKMIGYVPQESFLFSGTIRENLLWGAREVDNQTMLEAAKAAQIHETIEKLPNGYDTVIGQKGMSLSGGQRQRLSLARALVMNPKILLLDDTTSALDAATESKVWESLEQMDSTMLLITQKVKTASKCDSILLLDHGEVVAHGTHQELLATSTIYQAIVQSQLEEGETWPLLTTAEQPIELN